MNSFPEPSVAVLIPIYQTNLSATERASLAQGVAVLGRYPIRLMKPEGLAVDAILQEFPTLGTESFPDRYFHGNRRLQPTFDSPRIFTGALPITSISLSTS